MAGPTPGTSLTLGAALRAVNWRFEPADQISACPLLLRAAATVKAFSWEETAMEEAGDEPLFCERAAGIDIGKQVVSVTIRVPSDTRRGGRQQETREFGTTRRQLLEMADWLRCWQVERAGMEATSDYWKPVYFLLEREGLDCLLYQASQVKALPGRPKTDPLTELPGGVPQVSGRMGILVATVADHDHRGRCSAGPVAAGGAAGRVA